MKALAVKCGVCGKVYLSIELIGEFYIIAKCKCGQKYRLNKVAYEDKVVELA